MSFIKRHVQSEERVADDFAAEKFGTRGAVHERVDGAGRRPMGKITKRRLTVPVFFAPGESYAP